MTTAEYQGVIAGKPEIKELYAKHLVGVQFLLQEQLALMESQLPTQDEMDMANEQAVKKAQQDRMIDGGGMGGSPSNMPEGKENMNKPPQQPGTPPPTGEPPVPQRTPQSIA